MFLNAECECVCVCVRERERERERVIKQNLFDVNIKVCVKTIGTLCKILK